MDLDVIFLAIRGTSTVRQKGYEFNVSNLSTDLQLLAPEVVGHLF